MKKPDDQKALLEQAKRKLGYNNAELGKALGKREVTIKSWLASPGAAKRREMPQTAKMLLRHILKTKPKR